MRKDQCYQTHHFLNYCMTGQISWFSFERFFAPVKLPLLPRFHLFQSLKWKILHFHWTDVVFSTFTGLCSKLLWISGYIMHYAHTKIQWIFIKANILCTHAHKEMYSDEQEKMNHLALFGTQKKWLVSRACIFLFYGL